MFNFNGIKKFFTFRNILLISFYILIFSILLRNSYSYLDPDFGWHLKFGQEALQMKSVPHIEHYNFTLFGERWVDHEWLLNIIVYLIYSKFGYLVLSLFFASIIVSTFIFLNIFLIKKYKPNIFNLIILLLFELLGVFGVMPHFGIRVQEINFLFLLLLLFTIFHFEKNRNYKILFLVPPLLFLWSCLHGAFLIGFVILFIFFCVKILELILKKFKKFSFIEYSDINQKDLVIFASISVFGFLLTFFGPYKLELYSFLYQYRDTFYLTHISEWVPIYYIPVSISKFFYLVIAVAIIIASLFYTRFKKIKLFEFFISIMFLVMAIKSKRHFPLLFIGSIFFIADYLFFLFYDFSEQIKKIFTKFYFINKILIIIVILILSLEFFLTTGFTKDPFLSFKNTYPVEMLDCVKNDKENNQRLFIHYGWGGYMIWKLPEAKLFLDGRLPQYPFTNGRSILQEYYSFFEAGRSEELLDKYDVKMVFLKKDTDRLKFNWLERFLGYNINEIQPTKDNLKEYLDSSNKWRILCEQDIGIVFIRK